MNLSTGREENCEKSNIETGRSTFDNSEVVVLSPETTLDCDKCEKKFKSKLGLQKHQLRHTETGPFICDYCGAKFKGSNGLKIHKRLHTGMTTTMVTVFRFF